MRLFHSGDPGLSPTKIDERLIGGEAFDTVMVRVFAWLGGHGNGNVPSGREDESDFGEDLKEEAERRSEGVKAYEFMI